MQHGHSRVDRGNNMKNAQIVTPLRRPKHNAAPVSFRGQRQGHNYYYCLYIILPYIVRGSVVPT